MTQSRTRDWSRSPARGVRSYAWVPLLAYVVLLAIVLFSPSSDVQARMAGATWRDALDLGASARLVTFDRVEVALNVVVIVPLTFLAGVWRPRYNWRDWTAFAFAGSVCVELLQGLLLPARQASFSDIVANTAGALIGAVLARLVLLPRR